LSAVIVRNADAFTRQCMALQTTAISMLFISLAASSIHKDFHQQQSNEIN
jgi:hypothetical protein